VVVRGFKNHAKDNGKFKPLKTIEHSDSEKEKRKLRHHTQPRNFQRQYGLSGDNLKFQGASQIPSSVSFYILPNLNYWIDEN